MYGFQASAGNVCVERSEVGAGVTLGIPAEANRSPLAGISLWDQELNADGEQHYPFSPRRALRSLWS